MMAAQRHIFPFIIIILSVLSSYNCLHNEPQEPKPHNSFEEETGYDFQAYPSYFSTITDKFVNSVNLETNSTRFERLLTSAQTINVANYGAKGDGSDATQAFIKAWDAACSSTGAVLVVPQGKTYLLRPITFKGPCKAQLTVQIYGTLEAPSDRSAYSTRGWLVFDSVQNLIVEGGGIINGNGKVWWQNSCKVNKALPCKDAPTALTFYNGKNLVVNNLKIQNAQQIHVLFEKCVNVQASNLMVTAPENSPNTDGIHVSDTQNIQISNCVIGTGDDCISIVSGSQKVQALDITCGPGHGISIGSLGSGNSAAYVSDVTVNGATLSGTTNGVRIKTWQGGSGSATGIKFQNINMHNVANPIIIDQNYCDQSKSCKQQGSAVQVKNVVYQNIKGTSASNIAVNFDCSKNFPCQGIVLQNVNIASAGGGASKALCNNVNLSEVGTVSPKCP